MIQENKKRQIRKLPFVKNTALQEYLKAEEGLKNAYYHGYSHWYIDFSLAFDSPETWYPERINQLIKLIEVFNVHPIMHGNFKAPLASDLDDLRLAAVEYTKKEIQVAQRLSAPLIIHGGGIVEPRLVKQVKQKALENFLLSAQTLVKYAKERGVEIWVENLSNYKKNHPFYYIFTQLSEFEYILSNCEEIKFFLDIGHANIGNTNIAEIIETLHKKIVGISVSNNNGERDQHIGVFNGSIDYKEIIAELLRFNWQGFVGVEVRDVPASETLLQLVEIYEEVMENRVSVNA